MATQGPCNEAVLRRFLLKSRVGVLYADDQTTYHYAALYRHCVSKAPYSYERYVIAALAPAGSWPVVQLVARAGKDHFPAQFCSGCRAVTAKGMRTYDSRAIKLLS